MDKERHRRGPSNAEAARLGIFSSTMMVAIGVLSRIPGLGARYKILLWWPVRSTDAGALQVAEFRVLLISTCIMMKTLIYLPSSQDASICVSAAPCLRAGTLLTQCYTKGGKFQQFLQQLTGNRLCGAHLCRRDSLTTTGADVEAQAAHWWNLGASTYWDSAPFRLILTRPTTYPTFKSGNLLEAP